MKCDVWNHCWYSDAMHPCRRRLLYWNKTRDWIFEHISDGAAIINKRTAHSSGIVRFSWAVLGFFGTALANLRLVTKTSLHKMLQPMLSQHTARFQTQGMFLARTQKKQFLKRMICYQSWKIQVLIHFSEQFRFLCSALLHSWSQMCCCSPSPSSHLPPKLILPTLCHCIPFPLFPPPFCLADFFLKIFLKNKTSLVPSIHTPKSHQPHSGN